MSLRLPGLSPQHSVYCIYCEKSRAATESGVVETTPTGNGLATRTTLVSCDECGGPLLFAQEDDCGAGFDSSDMVRVWPGAAHLSIAVPMQLRDVHQEARRCFDAKAYTATVVMVGRALEGVCSLNNIKADRLVDALSKLKERGYIDERLHDWTIELRVLRNQGAHYTGDVVNREDARDALDLCEAILDYVYVLREKFNEFKERRAKKADRAESK
jgi:Domain of unknown function (DUF4145)